MIVAAGRDDVRDLLARLGLDSEAEPTGHVDADVFYDVLETIAEDDAWDLPIRAAEMLDVDSYGALGLAFKTSRDVRTALMRLERYGALVSEAIEYELRQTDQGGASMLISGRPPSRLGSQLTNEAALAGVLTFCRQIVPAARAGIRPKRVTFTHVEPPAAEAHRAFFGCPIDFGASDNALHFDRAVLDQRARLADDALADFLSARLDDELRTIEFDRGIEARVRRTVAAELADGTPTMRTVAARLAMSERTLRRRLAGEGLQYEGVVANVQETIASSLLVSSDHSLADVAFLTGYADQTAFHRAFKRWTGRTPQEFRVAAGHAAGRDGQ